MVAIASRALKGPSPKDDNYFLSELGSFVRVQGFSAAFVPVTMFNPVANWCNAPELLERPVPQRGRHAYPPFDGNAASATTIL